MLMLFVVALFVFMAFMGALALHYFSRRETLEILGRILLEFLDTTLAADTHQLVVVYVIKDLSITTQFLSADHARLEYIGFLLRRDHRIIKFLQVGLGILLEFFGTTFAMPRSNMAKAKKLIRKFNNEFCDLLEASPTDAIYHLEIALYPVATEGVNSEQI